MRGAAEPFIGAITQPMNYAATWPHYRAEERLRDELPNVEWISFVYAWFGTSIDVGACDLVPKCEYAQGQSGAFGAETSPHLWSVAGGGRSAWPTVSTYTLPNGQTALSHGGTISDGSAIRAVQELKARGYKVLFYPFIMMDLPPPDPGPSPGAAGSPALRRMWLGSSPVLRGISASSATA